MLTAARPLRLPKPRRSSRQHASIPPPCWRSSAKAQPAPDPEGEAAEDSEARFAPQFQLELMDKDLRYFLSLAQELDRPTPIAALVRSQ